MNLRKILHFIWRDKFNENPLPIIDVYIKEWYEKPKFVILKEEDIDECITLDMSKK